MKLESLILKTLESVSDAEMALAWLRYRQMRTMGARELDALARTALVTSQNDAEYGKAVDEIIDNLVKAHASTKGVDHK